MGTEVVSKDVKPLDGDWCLVDLSDDIPEKATRVAHALGLDFYTFMCAALEEKLARLSDEQTLG